MSSVRCPVRATAAASRCSGARPTSSSRWARTRPTRATSPEAYAAGLADAFGSERGQAVDVSANRTTLELSGEQARSVLEKSCEVDLHPRVFPAGTAIATLLGSTGVVLWRTTEDTWRVMPRASFATHVARWLLDGMREYR